MPSLPAILAPSISPRRINAVRFGTKIELDGEEQRWRRRKQQQRRPSRRPSIGWTGDLHDDQAAGALFLVVLSCKSATRMIVVADGLPLCCGARATQRRARFTRWQWRPACTHRVVWLFPARCRIFVFHSEETRESWLLKSESICFPFSSTAAIPISAFIKRRSDGS